MHQIRILLVVLFSVTGTLLFAQQKLSGHIVDEHGIAIPSAKVFVKNSAELRTIADANGYYEMWLFQGEYYMVIAAMGYEDKEAYVLIDDLAVEINHQLNPVAFQDLEDISVSAKKSNPGREIMLEVVKRREVMSPWNYPHEVEGYIRATEKIDQKESKKDKKEEEKKNKQNNEEIDPDGLEDPFAEKRKEDDRFANSMNLVEVQFDRYYGGANKVKEVRNAFEQRGNKENNLYYTTTVKSNFDFFSNLLHLDDLHQTPVSSPISGPGILSYKYRLEAQYEENGYKIHKIKILPRNISTTTLEGYIYVIDSIFLVQKLELTMNKGNLLVYDHFTIRQEFENQGDTLCVLKRQELDYGVKYTNESSTCSTIADFSNYKFNAVFEPKFFGNELAVTEQEAYDRDSSYWNNQRKTQLTEEELRYITVKDSIEVFHNKKEYLDSIDRDFNRVTALKVLWWGVDHRNRAKKVQWTINSFAATLRPIYIAGPRIAPGFSYFKKWEDETSLDSYTEVSIGVLNWDPKIDTWWRYRYDPFHFGRVGVNFSHSFDVIRSFDAITQIYKRDNFIEVTQLELSHSYEILNGMYLDANFEMSERRSLEGYKFLNTDDILPNNDPTKFETYQAFIVNLDLSYTPGQKYMREPRRKVVLGSKWPTFYLSYEKGIPKIFGSDVDHDYLSFAISQSFKIGTLGTSSYYASTGTFLNTRSLKDADQKYQRRSDPIWFSNPLYSFQGLDSSLPTQKIYYQVHFVHHDNGSILNKIPFMKKTRIGLVVGGGYLYVPEFDWHHYEVLAGLERNIKFSKRRLRIGIYGVMSGGNHITPTPSFKVSFAVLDTRNMKWNF